MAHINYRSLQKLKIGENMIISPDSALNQDFTIEVLGNDEIVVSKETKKIQNTLKINIYLDYGRSIDIDNTSKFFIQFPGAQAKEAFATQEEISQIKVETITTGFKFFEFSQQRKGFCFECETIGELSGTFCQFKLKNIVTTSKPGNSFLYIKCKGIKYKNGESNWEEKDATYTIPLEKIPQISLKILSINKKNENYEIQFKAKHAEEVTIKEQGELSPQIFEPDQEILQTTTQEKKNDCLITARGKGKKNWVAIEIKKPKYELSGEWRADDNSQAIVRSNLERLYPNHYDLSYYPKNQPFQLTKWSWIQLEIEGLTNPDVWTNVWKLEKKEPKNNLFKFFPSEDFDHEANKPYHFAISGILRGAEQNTEVKVRAAFCGYIENFFSKTFEFNLTVTNLLKMHNVELGPIHYSEQKLYASYIAENCFRHYRWIWGYKRGVKTMKKDTQPNRKELITVPNDIFEKNTPWVGPQTLSVFMVTGPGYQWNYAAILREGVENQPNEIYRFNPLFPPSDPLQFAESQDSNGIKKFNVEQSKEEDSDKDLFHMTVIVSETVKKVSKWAAHYGAQGPGYWDYEELTPREGKISQILTTYSNPTEVIIFLIADTGYSKCSAIWAKTPLGIKESTVHRNEVQHIEAI